MKHKVVKISSIFPASKNTVWDNLQRLDTLQYSATPYATFSPTGNTEIVWEEGGISEFTLRVFGFLSLGIHTINVIVFCKDTLTVYTEESNKQVPVWNHKIWINELSDNKVQYTDEVEIYAGWKTPFVYCWSYLFYKHRQKKWIELLRQKSRQEEKG